MFNTMKSRSFIFSSIFSLTLLFSGNATAQDIRPPRAQRVLSLDIVSRSGKIQTEVRFGGDSPTTWVDLDYWSSFSWIPSSRYTFGPSSKSQPTPEDIHGITVTLPNGTIAAGTILNDDIFINQLNVSSLLFGSVNTDSSTTAGILGLGSDPSVSIDRVDVETGLLQKLVGSKVINDEIYSIRWDPDDSSSSNGTLLIGGIDTNAYRGRLIPMPLSRAGTLYTSDLSGISLISNNRPMYSTETAFGAPVIFNSTSPTIQIPLSVLSNIILSFGDQAIRNERNQTVVPCDLPPSTLLSFSFNRNQNLNIEVPFTQLITPDRTNSGRCLLNLEPSPNNNVYLGTTFQRNAYTVFDLRRRQLFVAPSSRRNKTDAPPILVEAYLFPIGINKSPVPDLEGGAPAPPPMEFNGQPPRQGDRSRSNSNPLSTEVIIGIVIATVGIALIVALGLLCYRKRIRDDVEEKSPLTLGHHGYANPTFRGLDTGFSGSVRSFEDYVALQGHGEGWIIDTGDGVRHASWVREGKFKLGK